MLRLSQAITSVYILTVYLGFRRLRARLVWVDGNQVEKLRVALLDTRQTHVTSEQNLGWGVGAIADKHRSDIQTVRSEKILTPIHMILN